MIDQLPSTTLDAARHTQPPTRAVKPLALHRLSVDEVRFCNQIAKRRVPLRLEWSEQEWSITMQPWKAPSPALMEEVLADWGGAPVRIRMDLALLETVISQWAGSAAVCEMPAEIRAVLVETALDGVFSQVQQSTRKRFSLASAQSHKNPEAADENSPKQCRHGFLLQLDDADTCYSAEVWVDALGLGFVANALRNWPASPLPASSWGSLPVPVVLCAGWTQLSMSVVRSLSKHDVVLMDESFIGESHDCVVVMLGRRRAIAARTYGSRLQLLEEMEGILEDFEENEPEEFDEIDLPASLDEIPVRLQFDLGERVIPLAELQSIGPGHVFELGREIRRAVMIRANGRLVGEGELVDVDGRIGVSIQQIIPPAA